MTYAKKTLSEIKLIHGDFGNFIKGQKLDKRKEKKYKTPPYKDLAASNEIDGEPLDEKCWPGYEKKGMKTMFGKRYPNCVKKKKTRKEDFSDWRSDFEQIDEKKMTKAQIKKRDEIADAIGKKDMKKRYGDENVRYAIATKLAMKEGVGSVVKGGLKLGSKLLKKSAPFMGGATVGGTIGYETGKEKEREKTDAMMRSAYQDQGMLLQTNSDLRKQIKDLKKKAVKEDNIQEILDKKDVPHVKKLVGKLRKGSKTHAKQADDLEKAMNEGVGNVIKKLAKTVGKKVGSGAKTLGKVADDPVKSLGMGASVGGASAILINQRKEINRRNRRNNPTVEENVNVKFALTPNKKSISLNYGDTTLAHRTKETYKSPTSPKAAINKALVQFRKKDDFIKKDIGEDITDEALTIQDWNVDDIKFTEIETVDIIKAKPLLDEKFQFLKKAFGKAVILGTGASKAMGKSPRLSRKASISLTTGKALKGFKDVIQKVKDLKKIDAAPSKFPRDTSRTITKTTDNIITIDPSKMGNRTPRVIKKKNPPTNLKDHYDWRAELDEDWQKVNRQDKTDGLSRKAVKAYRRENPGSKLQTAVTKDPKKLKKGSKAAKRRLSFCRRMKGMKKRLTSAKTARDPNSRINKALRRWNC